MFYFLFTELASESEKVFGNDGEFFHVQQADPVSTSSFRDSGYYDGMLDSTHKLSFNPKSPSLQGLSEIVSKDQLTGTDTTNNEKTGYEKTVPDTGKGLTAAILGSLKGLGSKAGESGEDKTYNKEIKSRPAKLEVNPDKSETVLSPASLATASDSEYHSGKESPGSSGSDAPPTATTPETSVDTGEMFLNEAESTVDSNTTNTSGGNTTNSDKPQENCVIS